MSGHGYVSVYQRCFYNMLLRSGSAAMMDMLSANSALYSSKSACYGVESFIKTLSLQGLEIDCERYFLVIVSFPTLDLL
jgi:hypothetical protein